MSTLIDPIKSKTFEKLKVKVFKNRKEMGRAAAIEVADKMKELLATKNNIRMVFAAAPSQNEFLAELRKDPSLDWARVTVFHMDEYIGLSREVPQSFSHFLCEQLFDEVKPGEVHLLDGTNDPSLECERYQNLITSAPIDIVCLGIGENGHIAFNDPPVADFNDPKQIKQVELDRICRQQQVNDGCFPTIDDVPTHALTLTIPTILAGTHLFCIVPGKNKKEAVQKTLYGPKTTDCPASAIRRHGGCQLYLEKESFGGVESDANDD